MPCEGYSDGLLGQYGLEATPDGRRARYTRFPKAFVLMPRYMQNRGVQPDLGAPAGGGGGSGHAETASDFSAFVDQIMRPFRAFGRTVNRSRHPKTLVFGFCVLLVVLAAIWFSPAGAAAVLRAKADHETDKLLSKATEAGLGKLEKGRRVSIKGRLGESEIELELSSQSTNDAEFDPSQEGSKPATARQCADALPLRVFDQNPTDGRLSMREMADASEIGLYEKVAKLPPKLRCELLGSSRACSRYAGDDLFTAKGKEYDGWLMCELKRVRPDACRERLCSSSPHGSSQAKDEL